jgi:enamine deaminase RidA (YjgF/YER057c/UK114 family)
MSAEARLAAKLSQLGTALPPAPKPKGMYKPLVFADKLAYTAGHLPLDAAGAVIRGRLGADLDVAGGQKAALAAGLGLLSTLREALGSLDRVRRVVKVLAMVNSTADFEQQPAVVNGCSELLAEVFGPDAGVGVRSAVGVNTLPLGAAVEIEAVFEVE